MLVDETVAQSARVAAGKRLGDDRFGELRVLQRRAMHRAAARFVGEQERRPELRGDGAGPQHAADIVSRREPARRDDRDIDDRQRGQQMLQRIGRRLRSGIERAAMPARRRALRHHHIDAAGDRRLGLRQCRHGADGGDADVTKPLALSGGRQAERERRPPPGADRAPRPASPPSASSS